jgi:hypothetical protein
MFDSTQKKIVGIVAAVIAVAAIGGGAAVATGVGDDDEQPITGEALEKASEAALDYTGEGHVSETEVGDEDSYYEVDVQLDEDFNIVGDNVDDDSGGEDGD